MSGIDADRLPPLVARRRRSSASCCPRWPSSSVCPAGVVVHGRHERQPRRRVRHRRFAAGTTGLMHRHHRGAARHHRPHGRRPRPRGPVDAEPARRPLPRVGRERDVGQGRSSTCSASSSTPPMRSATTARRTRSARSTPRSARPSPARAACCSSRGCRLALAERRPLRAGRLPRPVARHRARIDLVRAAVEGTRPNLRWLLPFVEQFSGPTAATDDRLRRWRGPLGACGPRSLADVLEKPVDTLRRARPRGRPRRRPGRAAAGGALPPGDLSGLVEVEASYEPRPVHRRPLRRAPGPVRGRLRRAPPDPSSVEPLGHRPKTREGHPMSASTPTPTASASTASIPEHGRAREEVLGAAADDGQRGGRSLGGRQVLRDDVLRRPRPLRLHERGVRPVRPRRTRSSATCARARPASRARSSP